MSRKPAGNNTADPRTTSTVHLPGAVFDRRQLDRHFEVQGCIAQRFWAKPIAVWKPPAAGRRQLPVPA